MIATKAHLIGVNENLHLYLNKQTNMSASKEGIISCTEICKGEKMISTV